MAGRACPKCGGRLKVVGTKTPPSFLGPRRTVTVFQCSGCGRKVHKYKRSRRKRRR